MNSSNIPARNYIWHVSMLVHVNDRYLCDLRFSHISARRNDLMQSSKWWNYFDLWILSSLDISFVLLYDIVFCTYESFETGYNISCWSWLFLAHFSDHFLCIRTFFIAFIVYTTEVQRENDDKTVNPFIPQVFLIYKEISMNFGLAQDLKASFNKFYDR